MWLNFSASLFFAIYFLLLKNYLIDVKMYLICIFWFLAPLFSTMFAIDTLSEIEKDYQYKNNSWSMLLNFILYPAYILEYKIFILVICILYFKILKTMLKGEKKWNTM